MFHHHGFKNFTDGGVELREVQPKLRVLWAVWAFLGTLIVFGVWNAVFTPKEVYNVNKLQRTGGVDRRRLSDGGVCVRVVQAPPAAPDRWAAG